MRLKILGVLPLTFYGIFVFEQAILGKPTNALWACQVANIFVGISYLLLSPGINGIAFCVLAYGNILWVIYLIGGGFFSIGSLLTHLFGGGLSLILVLKKGLPKNSWWKSGLFILLMFFVSKFFSNPRENVNLAFRVEDGWESQFPNYTSYLLLIYSSMLISFFLVEKIVRKGLKTIYAKIDQSKDP